MNRSRQGLLSVVALFGLVGSAQAANWQEQSEANVPVAGLRSVRVENARGLVSVTRAGAGEIRITALKLVRSNDTHWAERAARETQVVTETHGEELLVRVIYPQNAVNVRFWELFSDFEMPRLEVRLALEVPPGLGLHLKSTSGDLSTRGIKDAQRLESTSGDMTVSEAGPVSANSTSGDVELSGSGPIEIRTVSGDVTADDVEGKAIVTSTSGAVRIHGAATRELELTTVSGDIVADEGRGLTAGTTSGDIEVRRVSGAIHVHSTSGDVTLGVEAPLQHLEVGTLSGDVRLSFPRVVPCALDLVSTGGSIQVDNLPVDLEDATRHRVKGVVGGGTAPLAIHTASGDIHLTEGAR